METKVKSLEQRRLIGRRKRQMKLFNKGFEISLRKLDITKISRELENKKVKLTKNCLKSLLEEFYEHRVCEAHNQDSVLEECSKQMKNLEDTIDLCDAESSVNNINAGVVIVPPTQVQPKNETVIDLSADVPEQMEVIDLTETLSAPLCNDKKTINSLETTVVDISEEESKGKTTNANLESDEISVIATFNKKPFFHSKCDISPSIRLSNHLMNFSELVDWNNKFKQKYTNKHLMLNKRKVNQNKRPNVGSYSAKVARVEENIYVHSPVIFPSSGLRPIIIDGSNVAFVHSSSNFCCKRLEICINYFKEKGHKVTAFVPQFRLNAKRSDDPQLLKKLERQGDVVLTPSKKIDGRNIVPYDDRFIVQTAVLKGGIIVTRDNYNDLLNENPAWAETIKYRTLAFTWVDDVLMFPKDPLGEHGPSLEEFLRFH